MEHYCFSFCMPCNIQLFSQLISSNRWLYGQQDYTAETGWTSAEQSSETVNHVCAWCPFKTQPDNESAPPTHWNSTTFQHLWIWTIKYRSQLMHWADVGLLLTCMIRFDSGASNIWVTSSSSLCFLNSTVKERIGLKDKIHQSISLILLPVWMLRMCVNL